MNAPTVFIDGQEGTTGLRIRDMLSSRSDIELMLIEAKDRKDRRVRADFINQSDVTILCLPDGAAAQALELVNNEATRLIDTSSSRRVDPNWVYGLPELAASQREAIRSGTRVANPGCYPQSFILAVKPLIDARKLAPTTPFSVNAVSGYSGGGRAMVEQYEAAPPVGNAAAVPLCLYGVNGGHKHLPEMAMFSGASRAPLFVPSVDHTFCGMLVSTPLPNGVLNGLTRDEVYAIWMERYGDEPFVCVHSPAEGDAALRHNKFLDLTDANFTNRLDLFVFGDERNGLVLVGRLDNLGKGASSCCWPLASCRPQPNWVLPTMKSCAPHRNAVQCLNLMLGTDESAGLRVTSRVEVPNTKQAICLPVFAGTFPFKSIHCL